MDTHKQMEENAYQSPWIKVVKVQQTKIVCASTERLEEDEFNWN